MRAWGERPAPGAYHFLGHADPAQWVTNVQGFAVVKMASVAPGVDVALTASRQGISLALSARPGSDPADVIIRAEGHTGMCIEPDGSLGLVTGRAVLSVAPTNVDAGTDRQFAQAPAGFACIDPCRFRVETNGNLLKARTIGLGVSWTSFVGGGSEQTVVGVGLDQAGNVVLVGATDSLDFPLTGDAFDTSAQGDGALSSICFEAFVTKLSPDGQRLVFSTYLGGSGPDCPKVALVRKDGSVLVVGWTRSSDFPTTPESLDIRGGPAVPRVFVTCVSPNGNGLEYSALIGGFGLGINEPRAIAADASDNTIVCGSSGQQATFPVTPDALDSTKGPDGAAFIARISSDGSQLLYGSYLGSDTASGGRLDAVAVSSTGDVVVAGSVPGQQATPGAFDPVEDSIFVARMSPDLRSIKAATYLGGVASEQVGALAVGPQDEVLLAGETASDDFPITPLAFQTQSACAICADGFVTCLDPMLTSLVYSTYLAGGLSVAATDLHVDGARVATVVGSANGAALPTTVGAFDESWNGFMDMFVVRLSPDGRAAWYSSYLGGAGNDGQGQTWPVKLAVDETGSAVIASTSNSPDFPATAGSFQTRFSGAYDAVVAHLELLPAGATKFGVSTPGCLGPLAIGVTSIPQVGNEIFALTCTNGPPMQQGFVAISLSGLAAPIMAAGTQAWIDPAVLVAVFRARSNSVGLSLLPVRLPSNPAAIGLEAYAQYFWPDPCGPAGWSASNALHLTVQP
jgi:hypothetical protein